MQLIAVNEMSDDKEVAVKACPSAHAPCGTLDHSRAFPCSCLFLAAPLINHALGAVSLHPATFLCTLCLQ